MSTGKAARRRRQHLLRELERLSAKYEHARHRSPGNESPARRIAEDRYTDRLNLVLNSWRAEMCRRADRLDAPRVWAFVDDVRAVMGDKYGDMAANLASEILERLLRGAAGERGRRARRPRPGQP